LSADADWPIRLAAFTALSGLAQVHGDVLPWALIARGFEHGGRRFLFANMSKGIFRPEGMQDAALSVKTTVPRSGAPKYGCPRGLMEARQRDFVARGPCS
jgi:putative restriction endonuclease